MGYSFIPQLLFYFWLMKTRHHGEKRIRDADTLPVCCCSVGNIQRLWKRVIISAIPRGKTSASRASLIFHLCNLWGKRCVFLSLVLPLDPLISRDNVGPVYAALLIPSCSASVVLSSVFCIICWARAVPFLTFSWCAKSGACPFSDISGVLRTGSASRTLDGEIPRIT